MTKSLAASAVERANQPGFRTTSEPEVPFATVTVCVESVVEPVTAMSLAAAPFSFAVRVTTAEATLATNGMSNASIAVFKAAANISGGDGAGLRFDLCDLVTDNDGHNLVCCGSVSERDSHGALCAIGGRSLCDNLAGRCVHGHFGIGGDCFASDAENLAGAANVDGFAIYVFGSVECCASGDTEKGSVTLCCHLFAIARAKAKTTERNGALCETGVNLMSVGEANQFARQALVHITISSHD
jgi:hypothetical protein